MEFTENTIGIEMGEAHHRLRIAREATQSREKISELIPEGLKIDKGTGLGISSTQSDSDTVPLPLSPSQLSRGTQSSDVKRIKTKSGKKRLQKRPTMKSESESDGRSLSLSRSLSDVSDDYMGEFDRESTSS
jgi:hypothetical protein